mgnify:CR=1 FL=1
MLLNPSIVTQNYISFYNETKNVTILHGSYLLVTEKNVTNLSVLSAENITVNTWTLIIPKSINLEDLVSTPINFTFNQLMAEFTAYSKPGYIVETSLPLPYGGIEVNNGKALGINGFGQYVFYSNGTMAISIKLGFFTDLLMTAVDIFFYLLFIYFLIKNILGVKAIEVFKNAVFRNSGFKGNK